MLHVLEPYTREDNPVVHGLIEIDAPTAGVIVERLAFERQRLADKDHIGMLADMMLRGEFRQMSQLTFVRNTKQKGSLKLVDAQHRLRAQASLPADHPSMEWSVRVLVDEDPRVTYAYLDAYQKKRSAAVVARSLGFEGLSERALASCVAAAGILLHYNTEYTPPEITRGNVSLSDKIGYIDQHLDVFQRVDQALNALNVVKLKRRLYNSRIQSVIAATVAAMGESATEFWTSFAEAPSGPLRDAADRLHGEVPRKAPRSYHSRVVAAVWNHHIRGRDKKISIPMLPELRVEGTPLLIPQGK